MTQPLLIIGPIHCEKVTRTLQVPKEKTTSFIIK